MMTLGQKIRELRIQKGLTQSDLGVGLVTPSMISQIESDKANPSYKVLEAIAAKLETPLEYFLSDVQTQLEQGTAYKCAKALMASNSYDRAVALLESVLDKPASNLNPIAVRVDFGKCLLELSRYEEASVVLQKAVEQAMDKSEHFYGVFALNLLGSMEQRRKKPHLATYYWRTAYDLFPHLQTPEPFLQGELLNNLGAISNDLGETEDALTFYGEAMKLLQDTSNFEQIGMTYLGLALSYRQREQFERASEYANYAEALFQSTKNVRLAIEVKRKNVSTMNSDIALSTLEDCLVQCKTHGLTDDAASVYCDIALLHLQMNQTEMSLEAIGEGLAIAMEGSVTAAHLLRVKSEAFGRIGKRTEAVRDLEQAIYVYQSHDKKTELADCYTLLAELHQQAGDVLTANKCLHRMKQVLQESVKDRGFVFSA